MYEKFFEQKEFAIVRREIEYSRLSSFLKLNDNEDTLDEANEEELVNYLNFFEFIAMLQISSQLKLDDVNNLFGYYLKSINRNNFLKEYLTKYDFENLIELLKNYE